MKNGLKWVLVAVLAIVGSTAMAQQVKLGYLNSQELFAAMPERDSAYTKLQAYATELSDQLELIQVELNNKLQDYQKNSATFSDAVRQIKEKELQDINTRLQQTNQMAQEEIGKMEQTLMLPIYDKLYAAVDKVAKANGITAVFDSGTMLYYDESSMVDIMPLAKKELGIN